MNTIVSKYISECNVLYKADNATEHSYRPALKTLLEALMPHHTATNEPKRIACGAPDYIITDRTFAIGYVEAKDIPVNLNDKTLKEQFDRYRYSLDNLIITNYLTFRWYAKGELVYEIAIGKEIDDKIVPLTENFHKFTELIHQFVVYHTEGIKTSAELSKQMAAKARLLAEIIENSINKDIENKEDTELNNQYEGFKSILIDAISTKDFADLYAQTVAYGMFAARINYTSPTPSETSAPLSFQGGELPPRLLERGHGGEVFTREKAAKSIPQTNPFLRKMFGFIAGVDLDSRISWVVDALADLFNYVDIQQIHKEIGRYADNDPIIHFYETFLTDYDKRLKKQRGVWYTPQPVVRFIVNAVDDILKTDFDIAKGLADNSKVRIGDNEYHKVQILDPATGTGTFLAEIVEHIYSNFSSKGMWNNYVNEHLIPRLNGFEILMASYAMAHLKLEMLLQETNAEITNNQRIKIYLTDSLDEENDKDKTKQKKTSILKWLSDEANEAATIKRNAPIMVILGNPPYSVSSSNRGKWIADLCEDYKKNLNERNIQPLSDDYIKFIRLGQHYVEKNGFGILTYICNNSFIDGLIHKQMRKSLLETFDNIYIINLHGNSRKKETTPDGEKDENVFDIQQGVSINIFVKHSKKKSNNSPSKVYYTELYGKRTEKYSFLLNNNLQTVNWQQIKYFNSNCFFVPKDYELKEEYDKGFKISELFSVNSVGIVTSKDAVLINFDKKTLLKNIKEKLDINPNINLIQPINYRPFDKRYIYYDIKKVQRHRYAVMQHFLKNENAGLVLERIVCNKDTPYRDIYITDIITDKHNIGSAAYIYPLYLYHEEIIKNGKAQIFETKTPNLNTKTVEEISKRIGLPFTEEQNSPPFEGCPQDGVVDFHAIKDHSLPPPTKGNFAPIDILDYIYAVLHSPSYREKYKEFLKIDFPRVPYPENAEKFWEMAGFGKKIRKLHLMEGVEPQKGIADFPIRGSNVVEKPQHIDNKTYINDTQYFDNVPPEAWNSYIGGYQPAQKWLKDRKGCTLNFDDIEHYQRIIFVLKETGNVMKEIDDIGKITKINRNCSKKI